MTAALPRTTEWMSSEHKGGVVYDYWVSNPWHGRESLKTSAVDAALDKSVTIAAAARKGEQEEEADGGSDNHSTDFPEHSQTSVDGCSDEASNNASIPGGDVVEFGNTPTEP